VFHTFAVKANFNQITDYFANHTSVSTLAALEIAILILTAFFTANQIENHYQNNKKKDGFLPNFNFVAFAASVFFIVGMYIIQNWAFHKISGLSFTFITTLLAIGLFLLLFSLSRLIRIIFKEWSMRMETKMLLSFFQIIAAMMLPVFLLNFNFQTQKESTIYPKEISITIGLMIIFASIGFILYKYQIKEKIWSLLTK